MSDDSQRTASLNLAYRLYDLGDLEASSEQLAKVRPEPDDDAEYLYLKGLIHFDREERPPALACFERALKTNPDLPEVHRAIGFVHEAEGNLPAAAQSYCGALDLTPDDPVLQRNLLHALETFAWGQQLAGSLKDRIRRHLLKGIQNDELDLKRYLNVIAHAVLTASHVQEAVQFIQDHPDRESSVLQSQRFFKVVLNDQLLCGCLSIDILPVELIELVLTEVRRELLFCVGDPLLESDIPLSFVTALATQAYLTEYAYAVSADEAAEVQNLISSVSERLNTASPPDPQDMVKLAITAAYVSLGDWLSDIPAETLPAEVGRVCDIQIANPKIERALEREIGSLQPSADATSRAVGEQYEQNPFPRWNRLRKPDVMPVGKLLMNLFPQFEPAPRLFEPCSILIAGCGTGHQPIQEALRFPDADIVAIDLSRPSLAYAARMASEYGAANIRFLEADILALDGLEASFDVVECTGVLHHMADPSLGGRCLLEKLAPGGVFKLGLYSELARRHLSETQRWIKEQKSEPAPDTLRETRRQILSLPPGDPKRSAAAFVDFYSLSGVRDLLFHAHETVFSFPRIGHLLADWGINLIGIQPPGPQVAEAFKDMFPLEESQSDLSAWHAFETAHPDSFRQMYTLWCQKPFD